MIRDFLLSLTAWDWTCIFTAWLLLAVVTGVSLGRSIKQADEQEQPEVVNWLPSLPPVPRPTTPPFWQTLPDPSWFDGIPADCLSDDAVHSLFDSIVAGEFSGRTWSE